MKTFDRQAYASMSHLEKIRYLLSFGVAAKLDINDELEPVFYAFAGDVKLVPVGEHLSEDLAIAAGVRWLKEMESMAAISESAEDNEQA